MKIVLMAATSFAAWAAVRPARGLLRGFGADTSKVRRGPISTAVVRRVRLDPALTPGDRAWVDAILSLAGTAVDPPRTSTAVTTRRPESYRSAR
jgi:hypothetical protein